MMEVNEDINDAECIRAAKTFLSQSYVCYVCKRNFLSKNDLKKHGETHLLEDLFTCETCGKFFPSSDLYVQHCCEHEQNICHFCNETFLNAIEFNAHQQLHRVLLQDSCVNVKTFTNSMTITFEPKIKNKRFQNKIGIQNRKTNPHACHLCTMTFTTKEKLSVHLQDHSSFNHYVCTICGRYMDNQILFKCHIQDHFRENPLSCEVCGKKFKDRQKLLAHQKQLHRNNKRCDMCDLNFMYEVQLINHMLWHNVYKFHVCKICNLAFVADNLLQQHMQKRHKSFPPKKGRINH